MFRNFYSSPHSSSRTIASRDRGAYYGLDDRGIGVRFSAEARHCLFPASSKLALGPTPTDAVRLSSGGKAGRANHSFLKLIMRGIIPLIHLCVYGVLLN
jgi:hypothetical protein